MPTRIDFDLRISGVGYLTQLRKRRSKNNAPFWKIQIVALRGSLQNLRCTRFNCIASTPETVSVLNMLEPLFHEEEGLPIRFVLSGLQPNAFVHDKGRKTGRTEIFLNASLSRLSLADPILQGGRSMLGAIDRQEFERFSYRIGYSTGALFNALARILG